MKTRTDLLGVQSTTNTNYKVRGLSQIIRFPSVLHFFDLTDLTDLTSSSESHFRDTGFDIHLAFKDNPDPDLRLCRLVAGLEDLFSLGCCSDEGFLGYKGFFFMFFVPSLGT